MTDTNVWPNNIALDPQELSRESPHRLVCFLLSPFEPREEFDEIHEAVSLACQLCAESAGIDIDCRRADTLYESKTIHDDIWRHISAADLLVIDVTGLNPNVMIEFGVAAALRRPHQVILIKSEDDPSRLPFNAFAQRYLSYGRSIRGDKNFIAGLQQSMIQAITPAPYVPYPLVKAPSNGFNIDLREGDRPDIILSPGITHRRITNEGIEFGSFYVFRNSWLLLSNGQFRNVRARVRFRFQEIHNDPSLSFLGISLRNQHFHANWGHMVLLRADGKITRTEPENEKGAFQNVPSGSLEQFNYQAPEFIDVIMEMNDTTLIFKVGDISGEVNIGDMPYVYSAGKVRVSTSMCRVIIQEIELAVL